MAVILLSIEFFIVSCVEAHFFTLGLVLQVLVPFVTNLLWRLQRNGLRQCRHFVRIFSPPVPCLASAASAPAPLPLSPALVRSIDLAAPHCAARSSFLPQYFCLVRSSIGHQKLVNWTSSVVSVVNPFLVKDETIFCVINCDVIARTYEGRPRLACSWPDRQTELCGKSSFQIFLSTFSKYVFF